MNTWMMCRWVQVTLVEGVGVSRTSAPVHTETNRAGVQSQICTFREGSAVEFVQWLLNISCTGSFSLSFILQPDKEGFSIWTQIADVHSWKHPKRGPLGFYVSVTMFSHQQSYDTTTVWLVICNVEPGPRLVLLIPEQNQHKDIRASIRHQTVRNCAKREDALTIYMRECERGSKSIFRYFRFSFTPVPGHMSSQKSLKFPFFQRKCMESHLTTGD